MNWSEAIIWYALMFLYLYSAKVDSFISFIINLIIYILILFAFYKAIYRENEK